MADTTALARRFKIDVNVGTTEIPDWAALNGVTDFLPKVDPTLQESSDYDSDGWVSQEKTMQAWTAEITVLRKKNASGEFYAAQEALRACEDQFGDAARAEIRWYDRDGGDEAYQGTGIVKWERANSAVVDLDAANITITGDGARTEIANPLAVS